MYLFFQSYPVAFRDLRGWSPSLSSLPLLAIILGVWGGTVAVVVFTWIHLRRHPQMRDNRIKPEVRLPLMIVGGCLVPCGLFWYAWTSNPAIPWPSEVCAGGLIGLGMSTIFIQCFTYIIDCYTTMANSAMAANGTVRSIFGAVFPLFSAQMFHKLGVAWATSLIGFPSVMLIPVPVVLWVYGERIRACKNVRSLHK